jgi:CHAD domain-containing protein
MAKAKEIELDCESSAANGIALVLKSRLEEIFAFKEQALNWADSEGVHDMRVASRRLRSALRDFKPYLRKPLPERRLKELADALGAVRDEDVAIASLEKLAEEAEDVIKIGIEQLADEGRWRRERARGELEALLSGNALTKLEAKFMARLVRATSLGKGAGTDGELRTRKVGSKIILDRLAELQDAGYGLYYPLEPHGLHAMRISAKRLRYAIELFAACWGERLNDFADETADLQKSLGELHDCDIWIAELGSRLAKQDKEGDSHEPASPERRAAFWLMGEFVKRRMHYYRDALEHWDKWETSNFADRLQACLSEESPDILLDQPSSDGIENEQASLSPDVGASDN